MAVISCGTPNVRCFDSVVVSGAALVTVVVLPMVGLLVDEEMRRNRGYAVGRIQYRRDTTWGTGI